MSKSIISSSHSSIDISKCYSFHSSHFSVTKPAKSFKFSEQLAFHGFYKDTSMNGATKEKTRLSNAPNRKVKAMQKVNEEFDKEMKLILKLQKNVSNMQTSLASAIQREYSCIAIQLCYRCHIARVKLRELKLYRYVASRWRFYARYKIRRRSAKLIYRKIRTYVFRKSFLAILPFLRALRVIQRKYRSILAIRKSREIMMRKKVSRRYVVHAIVFGMTRAVRKMKDAERTGYDITISKFAIRFLRRYVRQRRLRL